MDVNNLVQCVINWCWSWIGRQMAEKLVYDNSWARLTLFRWWIKSDGEEALVHCLGNLKNFLGTLIKN